MNPAINFILGSVAFVLAAMAIFEYVWRGRLLRIAYQRRERLVYKLIAMYGAMLTTADMITRAGNVLQKMKKSQDAGRRLTWHPVSWCCFCYRACCSEYVLRAAFFLILVPLVILCVTSLYVFHSTLRIVFQAMVLWRAYKRNIHISFTHKFLNPFLRHIGAAIGSNEIVYILTFPYVYLIDKISNININLQAVQVTCNGAQSPLYLFVDIVVVGVVILVIQSDVQIFWTMMIQPSTSKIRSMVFSREYFFSHWKRTLLYLAMAMAIAQVRDPAELVSYCMGWVSIQQFFNMKDGVPHSNWVVSNPNCDAAITYSLGGQKQTLKIDTALANFSAIFAILLLAPGMYTPPRVKSLQTYVCLKTLLLKTLFYFFLSSFIFQ